MGDFRQNGSHYASRRDGVGTRVGGSGDAAAGVEEGIAHNAVVSCASDGAT